MSKSVVILAASATLIIGVALYYLMESRKKKKSEETSKKTNGVLPKETFTDGHKVSDNIAKPLQDEVQPKPEAEEEKIVIHKPEMKSWAFTTSGHSRGVTRTEDLTAALNAGLVHRPQVSDVDNLLHDDHVIEWKGFSDDITSVADSFAAIMGENPHQKVVESFGDEKEDIIVPKNAEKAESGHPSFTSQFTESPFGSLGVGDPSSEIRKDSPFENIVAHEESSEPMSDFVILDNSLNQQPTLDDESSLNSFKTAESEKSSDRKDDSFRADVDKAVEKKEVVQDSSISNDDSFEKAVIVENKEEIQDSWIGNDDSFDKAVVVEHKEVPNPGDSSNDSVDFNVNKAEVVELPDPKVDSFKTHVDEVEEAVEIKNEHQDHSSQTHNSFDTNIDKRNKSELVENSFENSDERADEDAENKPTFVDKNESASSEEDSGNASTDETKPSQGVASQPVDKLIEPNDAAPTSTAVDETSLSDQVDKNTERKKSWAEVVASKPSHAENVDDYKVETSHKTWDRSSSLNESQESDDSVNDHTFIGDDDGEDFSDRSETMQSDSDDDDDNDKVDETETFGNALSLPGEGGVEGKLKNVDKLKHVDVGATLENVADKKDSLLETSTHL